MCWVAQPCLWGLSSVTCQATYPGRTGILVQGGRRAGREQGIEERAGWGLAGQKVLCGDGLKMGKGYGLLKGKWELVTRGWGRECEQRVSQLLTASYRFVLETLAL